MNKRNAAAALKRRAYETLRELILSGQLKPGEALLEDELGARFGLSRTPIREILTHLAHERLVKRSPYAGTYVTQLTREDVQEIYEIRGALEALASRTAVSRISEHELDELERVYQQACDELAGADATGALDEFRKIHSAIISHAGNQRLEAMVRALDSEWQRVARSVVASPGYDPEPALTEKHEILLALRDRDAERAVRLIERHYANSVYLAAQFLPSRSAVPETLTIPNQPPFMTLSPANPLADPAERP